MQARAAAYFRLRFGNQRSNVFHLDLDHFLAAGEKRGGTGRHARDWCRVSRVGPDRPPAFGRAGRQGDPGSGRFFIAADVASGPFRPLAESRMQRMPRSPRIFPPACSPPSAAEAAAFTARRRMLLHDRWMDEMGRCWVKGEYHFWVQLSLAFPLHLQVAQQFQRSASRCLLENVFRPCKSSASIAPVYRAKGVKIIDKFRPAFKDMHQRIHVDGKESIGDDVTQQLGLRRQRHLADEVTMWLAPCAPLRSTSNRSSPASAIGISSKPCIDRYLNRPLLRFMGKSRGADCPGRGYAKYYLKIEIDFIAL